MTMQADSTNPKRSKAGAQVLGRSAATGRLVLKPASKAGAISVRDARTAATQVAASKKKQ